MSGTSLTSRYESFITAACIAVHSNHATDGFRQAELKFFAELFSNWCECGMFQPVLQVQSTQIMRFLEQLVAEGFARRVHKAGKPIYRLTRIGLIEMLSRLATKPYYPNKEQFFFVIYFLRNYKERLEQLVREEGKQFPGSLRLELESLLDLGRLLRQEKQYVSVELRKLKERISDAQHTSDFVRENMKKGSAFDAILKQVERAYPYEFNSQKPLSELIGQIPAGQRAWELTDGNLKRVTEIWQPSLRLLESYAEIISDLEAEFHG